MAIMQKFPKKLSLQQRLLLLLLTIFLIIVGIASVTIKDASGLTLLERLTNDNLDSSLTFSHGVHKDNIFTNLGNNLLVCSDKVFHLFAPNGDHIYEKPIDFSNPSIAKSRDYAVLFDAGGQDLYVLKGNSIVFFHSLPPGESILSVTINDSGWLALTSEADRYKGIVTVFDSSYKPYITIRQSSAYLLNALVTSDNSGVYILVPEQSNGVYKSKLIYYDFSDAVEPSAQISLGANMVLSMGVVGNRCWVLSDRVLFFLSAGGELLYKYDFDGKYLKRASLDGDQFVTVLLSNSPSSNFGTLLTINDASTVLGELALDEQVLSLSAEGNYVSVLTASSLKIYTKDLKELASIDTIQGIRKVVLYANRSISLISDELVRLHLP